MGKKEKKLTEKQIEMIEKVTTEGDRVEVIPSPEGLRLLRTRRKEIKVEE